MCIKDNSNLNNTLASIAIFLSFVALLGLVIMWGIWQYRNLDHERLSSHITIEFAQDSTLHMSEEDRQAIVDSLNNIMLRREQILANKYQYTIEKRALEDSLFSMGSILIAIVFAICGFFGFKSFQSIEEDAKAAKEAAKKAAKKAASVAATEAATEAADSTREQINEIVNQYLKANVSKLVENAVKKDQNKIIKDIIEQERNITIIPKLSDELEKFTNQIDKIGTIENTIESLKIQILQIAQKHDVDVSISSQVGGNNKQADATLPEEPENKFLKKK